MRVVAMGIHELGTCVAVVAAFPARVTQVDSSVSAWQFVGQTFWNGSVGSGEGGRGDRGRGQRGFGGGHAGFGVRQFGDKLVMESAHVVGVDHRFATFAETDVQTE